MTQSLIRLAQYSFFHHSTSLLRVSLPTTPPSASDSLLADATLGAGELSLEGIGVGARFPFADTFSVFDAFFAASLPARVKVSLFPLPNFFQTCPSLVSSLFN